jgi:hypothetical protein
MLTFMTWAVYAMTAPPGVRRLDDVPDGYTPPPIGTAEEVVARIREAAPDADTSDPRWVRIRGVEVTVGKGVQVRDLSFYLEDAGGIPVVLDLARALGVTAYDTESGERITKDSAPPVPPPLEPDELPKRRWWQRKK